MHTDYKFLCMCNKCAPLNMLQLEIAVCLYFCQTDKLIEAKQLLWHILTFNAYANKT